MKHYHRRIVALLIAILCFFTACQGSVDSSDPTASEGSVDNSDSTASEGENSMSDTMTTTGGSTAQIPTSSMNNLDAATTTTSPAQSQTSNDKIKTTKMTTTTIRTTTGVAAAKSSRDPIQETVTSPETPAAIIKLLDVATSDKNLKYDKNTLYYLDLRSVIQEAKNAGVSDRVLFDAINLVVTIQGIANRDGVHLYIDFIRNEYTFEAIALNAASQAKVACNPDEFWFEDLRRSGGFLENYTVQNVQSIGGVVNLFKSFIKGAVIWDAAVPATMNVASTVSGVEDLVPFCYDKESGVYDWFIRQKQMFTVKRNLYQLFDGIGTIPDTKVPSSGSRKCDAYLWAKALYLDTSKTHPTLMMYANDGYSWSRRSIVYDLENVILVNRDYYIAEKAFFVDLSPIEGQAPNDDRTQKPGTDYNTLCAILKKQNELADGEVITIGGFIPWWIKYTSAQLSSGAPNCIEAEWESAYLFSRYYAQMDADASKGFANCSVFRQVPLQKQYTQNSKTVTKKLEKNKHYMLFCMTDYDSAAMLGSYMPRFYTDERRGDVPLAWSFNTCLADRIPNVIDYMYRNKTDNDYFVMGDNGTGYLSPEALMDKDRPAGLNGTAESWIAHNNKETAKFDLDIGAFFIYLSKEVIANQRNNAWFDKNSISLQFQKVCSKIAPLGAGFNMKTRTNSIDGMPAVAAYMASSINCNDPGYIAGFVQQTPSFTVGSTSFGMYRCTWTSPTSIADACDMLEKQYGDKYEAVDPYTFFALYQQALEKAK